MKFYKKTHRKKNALDGHLKKLKKRGAKTYVTETDSARIEKYGSVVYYCFPNNIEEKKLALLALKDTRFLSAVKEDGGWVKIKRYRDSVYYSVNQEVITKNMEPRAVDQHKRTLASSKKLLKLLDKILKNATK